MLKKSSKHHQRLVAEIVIFQQYQFLTRHLTRNFRPTFTYLTAYYISRNVKKFLI